MSVSLHTTCTSQATQRATRKCSTGTHSPTSIQRPLYMTLALLIMLVIPPPKQELTTFNSKPPTLRLTNIPPMSLFQNATPPDHFRDTEQLRYVIRPAFLYFSLTFLTGCILGALRVSYIVPVLHVDCSRAEICEMPCMLVAMAGWAQFVMVRYQVPKVRGPRLAIGLAALGFMVMVELVGLWVGWGGRRDGEDGVWSRGDIAARGTFAAALGVFGLMPWMVTGMGSEMAQISKAVTEDNKTHLVNISSAKGTLKP